MRVLVQEIDRYGERPIKFGMVFLNDGPSNFKGENGKVDKELVASVISEFIKEDDFTVEAVEMYNVVMDKKGQSVLLSGEENDFTLTNVDGVLEER